MAFDQNPANARSELATLKGKTLAELHVEHKETCLYCKSAYIEYCYGNEFGMRKLANGDIWSCDPSNLYGYCHKFSLKQEDNLPAPEKEVE